MINDIIIFALSLWGVIALLFLFIFKMIVWRLEELTFTLPLHKHDKEILNRIFNIRSFCEFCGLEKKSTVVLVNYGAPEWFCQEILEFYINESPEHKIAVLLRVQDDSNDIVHPLCKLDDFVNYLKEGNIKWNELYYVTL